MVRCAFIAMLGVLAFAGTQDPAPSTSVGIFENQADVGNVLHPGSAEYDAKSKAYTVSGSGDNMWSIADQFHFVWKQVSARDISLTADIALLGESKEGHRKAVLMIRQSLDDDSPYVDAARHGEGLTSLQFRDQKGAITREVESNVSGPSRLRIEKLGDRFYMWIGREKGRLQFAGGSARVAMQAPFYVGIGVCAHQKDVVEKATFTNVDLNANITPAKAHYSTVETVLASGDARTGFVSTKRLKAAGWSPDGHMLTFETGGYRKDAPFTPLRTATPVGAPITVQPENKGEYVASNQSGTMQIWHKGSDGSQPEQITSGDFNNVSPHLSPDGRYLVFLSYAKNLPALSENQEVSLRLITLADKRVRTLATFIGGPGSLGTQPWSPDGRRVAFISYQQIE